MASFRVVVLEKVDDGPRLRYKYLLWADVPVSFQPFYANAELVSAWSGATGADNTALQTGAVVERVEEYSREPGTPLATVQADLESRWNAFQTEISGTNPWDRYGTRWDGVSWTNDGVT